MYPNVQSFITKDTTENFNKEYLRTQDMLLNLLDSPVKTVQHIGGTGHFNYPTEPILDLLIGVDNLHDITSLDEKRLNYNCGFYRLHHPYTKKVMMAKFNNMIALKQMIRLHIIQRDTPLYEQYLFVDTLLKQHPDIAEAFAAQKQKMRDHATTIREYETQKQTYFQTLYKQYAHSTV